MTLASVYASIGQAGVALVILALVGVYLAVRTFFYLRIVRKNFRMEYFRLEKAGPGAIYRTRGQNPVLAIVHELLTSPNASNMDVKSEVSYRFHRNFESIFRNLSWIRFISVVAPLLGLLGTVLGMLTVFKVISHNAAPDATMLAAGIWEALITTVMGLTIAIPMLMCYYYLKMLMQGYYIQTVECTMRLMVREGIVKPVHKGFYDTAPAGSAHGRTGAAPAQAKDTEKNNA